MFSPSSAGIPEFGFPETWQHRLMFSRAGMGLLQHVQASDVIDERPLALAHPQGMIGEACNAVAEPSLTVRGHAELVVPLKLTPRSTAEETALSMSLERTGF